MEKFYRGDTIGFYMQGDAQTDLDANVFAVLIYNNVQQKDIVFQKSELTQISTNRYYGEISNTITKSLHVGNYIKEILLGSDYTSIAKEEFFVLDDSHSKKLIV
ncbi:MAG TPA: hypothetical protein DCS17_04650 [Flavobacterium sp.]|nr:hypothetical protein [Flavobacterium sp.]